MEKLEKWKIEKWNILKNETKWTIEEWRNGSAPSPGPQNGRFSVEPSVGLTSLLEGEGSGPSENKSVSLAKKFNDTLKKIDGTEVKVSVHWNKQ